jgi:S1-C subfamily serine protease
MSMEPEYKLKDALKRIEQFRTADCLDDATIGLYAEDRLSAVDHELAKSHLASCLYCMKRLNDTTELLYYQRQKVQPSQTLTKVLNDLIQRKPSFRNRFKDFFSFSLPQWRFATISLAATWVVVAVILLHQQKQSPRLNPDSLVTLSSISSTGKTLGVQEGVIVSSDGYIEAKLQPMIGASTIKVTLRDGRTREINHVWKDEDTNIAVMKIDGNDLTAIPLADIESISIGQKIFAAPDANGKSGFIPAVISDFKQVSRKSNSVQYIQIASQTTTSNTGKLVDEKGNLLGFVITKDQNINFAAPADSYKELIKSGRPAPISDLSQVNFSENALNFYLKGILARDSRQDEQAIKNFEEAIRLNPRLTGARLELAYLYYKKQQFDKEAAQYQEVLKINPDDDEALYNLAWNLESHGRYQEAISFYEKALSISPEDKETLYQLGLSYLAENDKAKALEMYDRLKKLDPGNAELLRRLIK